VSIFIAIENFVVRTLGITFHAALFTVRLHENVFVSSLLRQSQCETGYYDCDEPHDERSPGLSKEPSTDILRNCNP
jgi:hypothetical protein